MDKETVDSTPDYFFNMFHEIRNALNIMMASCTMVNKHIDDRERITDHLERINVSVERITGLIDDILDVYKMEQIKTGLAEKSFSIDKLEEELKLLLEPLAVDKKLKFSISSERFNNREVVGDYDRLLQLLVNLATNSIKYTPCGGNVVLCFEELKNNDGGTVSCRFICKDDGIGMSQEFIGHIFEPFARAEDERIRGIKGTGLGMSIVKEIITIMGGKIHIDSTMDAGTTVTAQLCLKKNMRKG